MLKIPHSFPYLTNNHKQDVMSCFEQEYIGYDNNLSKKIKKKLKNYLDYEYMELTPSASLGLLLILKSLNLSRKDEIIIPSINCWSVYNIILMENCKPILCDVRSKKDFRVSYKTIKKQITKNTKVIIVTHMYGNLIEQNHIKKIKNRYPKIIIIEDFSTSLFSKENYKIGKYSNFAIGSFGSTKPLSGGIGGVVCSKKEFIDANYDQQMSDLLSFNIKISRLNQSLLLSQIESFNEYKRIKKRLITFYNHFVNIYSENSDDLFRAITFQKPNKLINYLKNYGISMDIRKSVQPNLAKELDRVELTNSCKFKKYYSLPLNVKAYSALKQKGLL